MGKEKRRFCCHQNFVPKLLSAPARGYIHVEKHEKNVYKIRLQRDFFKLATDGQSDKEFLLTSKFCRQGVVFFPDLGLYTCKKSFKMCLKSFFKEIVQMGKVMRAFCWHQHCPQGVFCPCPGAIYMYKRIKIYTRTRCQGSYYRTAGPLVYYNSNIVY